MCFQQDLVATSTDFQLKAACCFAFASRLMTASGLYRSMPCDSCSSHLVGVPFMTGNRQASPWRVHPRQSCSPCDCSCKGGTNALLRLKVASWWPSHVCERFAPAWSLFVIAKNCRMHQLPEKLFSLSWCQEGFPYDLALTHLPAIGACPQSFALAKDISPIP